MKTTIFAFSFLVSGITFLQAQTSMNASGGNASSTSSGNTSYSVGQAFQDTRSNSSLSVSEGVQQPYEITETMGVDISEISLNIKIFPNPTQDILNLKIDFSDYNRYHYEIYDSSSKILMSKAVTSKNTAMSISSYPAALYYLKVTKNGKAVKIFKVLKTDK
ncbi:T9SS type A sorting domain-containing protein [Epilithonimonas hungarica]|uniref:Por secretion system C-terminal sorting domain-containing protein n=1 Tax=Epilithonimonas hungarica TaxID=454006 RepID=A0A1G7LTE6_9FLAO|nr:T9SS type A sorting domain-containing protein [Epilithonimonas hungarica]SDF52250.1 Por secretion system C-terminal sorting domain-containing protein [Epilithonimonas hungarica]